MVSRIVTVVLLCLLAIIHAQLWIGAGSVDSVAQLRAQIEATTAANDIARKENARLALQIQDLREGKELVQEKARYELSMVKPNEIYVQIMRP